MYDNGTYVVLLQASRTTTNSNPVVSRSKQTARCRVFYSIPSQPSLSSVYMPLSQSQVTGGTFLLHILWLALPSYYCLHIHFQLQPREKNKRRGGEQQPNRAGTGSCAPDRQCKGQWQREHPAELRHPRILHLYSFARNLNVAHLHLHKKCTRRIGEKKTYILPSRRQVRCCSYHSLNA